MISERGRLVDVFLFNDEVGPLLARYLELKDLGATFVAIEGDSTLSGRPRSPKFWSTIESLGLDKNLFHLVTVNLPKDESPFARERIQRDSALIYLKSHFRDEDYILFGDVDEVPSREATLDAIGRLETGTKMAFFAQVMCVGLFNNVEKTHRLLSYAGEFPGVQKKDRRWLGTALVQLRSLSDEWSLSDLREPSNKAKAARIANGGWHFSSCGGQLDTPPQLRVAQKLQDFAHVEFQHIKDVELIRRRFERGRDVLGRRFVRFEFQHPDKLLSSRIASEPRFRNLINREC